MASSPLMSHLTTTITSLKAGQGVTRCEVVTVSIADTKNVEEPYLNATELVMLFKRKSCTVHRYAGAPSNILPSLVSIFDTSFGTKLMAHHSSHIKGAAAFTLFTTFLSDQ